MSLTPTDIILKLSAKIFELKDYFTIKGELHNYSKRNSNIFASLKDNSSSIDIVCWNAIDDFNNGDEVEIVGKINFYKKTSKINLIVSSIKKLGIGDQFRLYEELKLKFKNQGLFDRKKSMPNNIKTIGIVTSEDGAALQDVLYVLKNGGFNEDIIIKNCLVQGVNAPKSIANAIESFTNNKVDILLITRGGGSLEDLMAFSSESVVQAIYNAPQFTISAVGHEVDSMLSDFVADLRAPTPSVGAQIILNEFNKKFLILNDAQNALSKIYYELSSRISQIKKVLQTKDKLITNIIKLKLNQIQSEIRFRFRTMKIDLEKIKLKIDSGDDIMIINPESGIKIESTEELENEFIVIFKGSRLLINPGSIIHLN
jgi:exodeoxyribonuclease VII large subunit